MPPSDNNNNASKQTDQSEAQSKKNDSDSSEGEETEDKPVATKWIPEYPELLGFLEIVHTLGRWNNWKETLTKCPEKDICLQFPNTMEG